MFGPGAGPALFGHRLRSRDQRSGAPAARARHHGSLRTAEIGSREEEPRAARPRSRHSIGSGGTFGRGKGAGGMLVNPFRRSAEDGSRPPGFWENPYLML